MAEFPLRYTTPPAWTQAVLDDFDTFLQDHAAAEKKASGMAISMLSHYPDRVELVAAMADLAVEEMTHYREVVKWIHRRGGITTADTKDPYVVAFRAEETVAWERSIGFSHSHNDATNWDTFHTHQD